MARLLALATKRGVAGAAPLLAHVRAPAPPQPLADPLSERELQVLRLMETDLNSREMAAALVVSVNTVRSHVQHVYQKLGVHSRHEALTRARELGLL
jgi:LuxR family maltose regulon positive regulatory protein